MKSNIGEGIGKAAKELGKISNDIFSRAMQAADAVDRGTAEMKSSMDEAGEQIGQSAEQMADDVTKAFEKAFDDISKFKYKTKKKGKPFDFDFFGDSTKKTTAKIKKDVDILKKEVSKYQKEIYDIQNSANNFKVTSKNKSKDNLLNLYYGMFSEEEVSKTVDGIIKTLGIKDTKIRDKVEKQLKEREKLISAFNKKQASITYEIGSRNDNYDMLYNAKETLQIGKLIKSIEEELQSNGIKLDNIFEFDERGFLDRFNEFADKLTSDDILKKVFKTYSNQIVTQYKKLKNEIDTQDGFTVQLNLDDFSEVFNEASMNAEKMEREIKKVNRELSKTGKLSGSVEKQIRELNGKNQNARVNSKASFVLGIANAVKHGATLTELGLYEDSNALKVFNKILQENVQIREAASKIEPSIVTEDITKFVENQTNAINNNTNAMRKNQEVKNKNKTGLSRGSGAVNPSVERTAEEVGEEIKQLVSGVNGIKNGYAMINSPIAELIEKWLVDAIDRIKNGKSVLQDEMSNFEAFLVEENDKLAKKQLSDLYIKQIEDIYGKLDKNKPKNMKDILSKILDGTITTIDEAMAKTVTNTDGLQYRLNDVLSKLVDIQSTFQQVEETDASNQESGWLKDKIEQTKYYLDLLDKLETQNGVVVVPDGKSDLSISKNKNADLIKTLREGLQNRQVNFTELLSAIDLENEKAEHVKKYSIERFISEIANVDGYSQKRDEDLVRYWSKELEKEVITVDEVLDRCQDKIAVRVAKINYELSQVKFDEFLSELNPDDFKDMNKLLDLGHSLSARIGVGNISFEDAVKKIEELKKVSEPIDTQTPDMISESNQVRTLEQVNAELEAEEENYRKISKAIDDWNDRWFEFEEKRKKYEDDLKTQGDIYDKDKILETQRIGTLIKSSDAYKNNTIKKSDMKVIYSNVLEMLDNFFAKYSGAEYLSKYEDTEDFIANFNSMRWLKEMVDGKNANGDKVAYSGKEAKKNLTEVMNYVSGIMSGISREKVFASRLIPLEEDEEYKELQRQREENDKVYRESMAHKEALRAEQAKLNKAKQEEIELTRQQSKEERKSSDSSGTYTTPKSDDNKDKFHAEITKVANAYNELEKKIESLYEAYIGFDSDVLVRRKDNLPITENDVLIIQGYIDELKKLKTELSTLQNSETHPWYKGNMDKKLQDEISIWEQKAVNTNNNLYLSQHEDAKYLIKDFIQLISLEKQLEEGRKYSTKFHSQSPERLREVQTIYTELKTAMKEMEKLQIDPIKNEQKILELSVLITKLDRMFKRSAEVNDANMGYILKNFGIPEEDWNLYFSKNPYNIDSLQNETFDTYRKIMSIDNTFSEHDVKAIENPFKNIYRIVQNIEDKGKNAFNSINVELMHSQEYVKELQIRMNDIVKINNGWKGYFGDRLDKKYALKNSPELQPLSEIVNKDFIHTDEWKDFLSTLPQAKKYLEDIGYEFKENFEFKIPEEFLPQPTPPLPLTEESSNNKIQEGNALLETRNILLEKIKKRYADIVDRPTSLSEILDSVDKMGGDTEWYDTNWNRNKLNSIAEEISNNQRLQEEYKEDAELIRALRQESYLLKAEFISMYQVMEGFEGYEGDDGKINHTGFNSMKQSNHELYSTLITEATQARLSEEPSGQLSFLETTQKTSDLIEEETGQMAMFETASKEATDTAIEGQKKLGDYIDENGKLIQNQIEGQMTLSELTGNPISNTTTTTSSTPLVEEAKDVELTYERVLELVKEVRRIASDKNRTDDDNILAKKYLKELQYKKDSYIAKILNNGHYSSEEASQRIYDELSSVEQFQKNKSNLTLENYEDVVRLLHEAIDLQKQIESGNKYIFPDLRGERSSYVYGGDTTRRSNYRKPTKTSVSKMLQNYIDRPTQSSLDRLSAYVYALDDMIEAEKIFGKKNTEIFSLVKENIDKARLSVKAYEDQEAKVNSVYHKVGAYNKHLTYGDSDRIEGSIKIGDIDEAVDYLLRRFGIVKEINESEIASNEEVIASEENKRKARIAAYKDVPKIPEGVKINKQEAEASSSANKSIVEDKKEQQKAHEKTAETMQEEAKAAEEAAEIVVAAEQKKQEAKEQTTDITISEVKKQQNSEDNILHGTVEDIDYSDGDRKRSAIKSERGTNKISDTYREGRTGRTIEYGEVRNKNTNEWEPYFKELTDITQLEKEAIKWTNKLSLAQANLNAELRKPVNERDGGVIAALNDQIDRYDEMLAIIDRRAMDLANEPGYPFSYDDYRNKVDTETETYSIELGVKTAKQLRSELEKETKEQEKLIELQSKFKKRLSSINSSFKYLTEYTDVETAISDLTDIKDADKVEVAFNKLEDIINNFKQQVKSSASLDPVFAAIKKKNNIEDITTQYQQEFEKIGYSAEEAKDKIEQLSTISTDIKNIDITSPDGISKLGEKIKLFNLEEDRLDNILKIEKNRQQIQKKADDKQAEYVAQAYRDLEKSLDAVISKEEKLNQLRKDGADVEKINKAQKDLNNTLKQLEANKALIDDLALMGEIETGKSSDYRKYSNVYSAVIDNARISMQNADTFKENLIKSQESEEKRKNDELRSKLVKAANDSGRTLKEALNQFVDADEATRKEAESLLTRTKFPMNNFGDITSKNIDSVVKKLESDTNKLVDSMRKQHKKVEKESAKSAYSGQTKDYEQLLNEQLIGTTFEDATFKNSKVDSSGKTVLTFIEVLGDKVRETKVYIDDANDALDRLSKNDGKDFDIYSYEAGSTYRNARISDFDGIDEDNYVQSVIASYKELSKTEKQYQTLRASIENGTATDKQKADYEILCALRERYNNIIAKQIVLDKEEQLYYDQVGKSKIEKEERKYRTRQEIEQGRYDVLANQYHVEDVDLAYEEATRINNALNNTKQLMNSISNKNIDGFSAIFDSAQKEVEQFNTALKAGDIDADVYAEKIQKIANELNNVVTVLPSGIDNVDIEKEMKSFAKSLPNAEIGEFNGTNNTLQVTLTKGKGIIEDLILAYNQINGAVSVTKRVTKQAETSWGTFFKSLKKRFQSLLQYVMTFMSFYEVIGLVREGVTVIRELDTALTEMKKVSDESVSSLKNFQKVSFDIADSIGTTAGQIQNSAADFMRLGYSLEEASTLAKDANIYANVGDMEVDEATEHMISSIKAWESEFSNEVEASAAIIDRYNEIGNNFAISSADIGSAMERSAAALKAGGNTLNESLGLITAGNIIQQDAETTAAALKILSLRIRGSKAELEEMGESTDGLASSTSKLREQIKGLTGVDIMLDDNTYKSTAQIIQELGAVYNQLSDIQQANLLEVIAGKNRASTVEGLLQNYKTIEEVIKAAEGAEGSAAEENLKYVESIEGRIELFNNRLQEFWYNLLDSEMVKEFVDAGTKLIDILDNIVSAISDTGSLKIFTGLLSGLIDMVKGLTSALGTLNLPLLIVGITKLVNFTKGKKTSGGRVKMSTLNNMPPNRLAERCASPGVYRNGNICFL